MWQRLLFGILLAFAAYFVIQYFSNESFISFAGLAPATAVYEPIPRGDLKVSSGGPNPPNASPPQMPPNVSPPPEASDPYDATHEGIDAPEQLRFPERSFSPGVLPTQTVNHENSGLAGPVGESSQAIQQFSPELITNGGNFFGSVTANEDENPNYSSF